MGDALFHIAWHDVNAKVKDDDAVLDEDEVETASKHGDG
jgi:hypothetical protein